MIVGGTSFSGELQELVQPRLRDEVGDQRAEKHRVEASPSAKERSGRPHRSRTSVPSAPPACSDWPSALRVGWDWRGLRTPCPS
jgi:hypothetical protein